MKSKIKSLGVKAKQTPECPKGREALCIALKGREALCFAKTKG